MIAARGQARAAARTSHDTLAVPGARRDPRSAYASTAVRWLLPPAGRPAGNEVSVCGGASGMGVRKGLGRRGRRSIRPPRECVRACASTRAAAQGHG
jgi:hypothetical protein